ncbi:MAG: hypothetical protein MJ156_02700 [Alphaproteobacteria bacterium]|nr:hypothetical protein [Alphaproteobacteria bacterium]
MKTKIKKACELSIKILDQINQYVGDYTTADGKDVTTETSLSILQDILEEGFALHNYIVENKLYENHPAIEINLIQLEKFMNQLTITKENAEKLKLSNAVQVWNQAKIAIAVLASVVLEEYEEKE